MKAVAVLMAGGRSERLWPLSRQAMPKQFLDITGKGRTMIQMTVDRLLPLVEAEDMFVVTGRAYVPIVRAQLPELPPENILAEPMARDTAPCVAFAAAVLSTRYDDAVMMVLPSDHLIEKESKYIADMKAAAAFAEKHDALVTIGVTPTYPETGYGYIQYDKDAPREDGLCRVKRFVEKPNAQVAHQYVRSGNYLWNGGMFLWRLSVILEKIQAFLPEVYEGAQTIRSAAKEGRLEEVLEPVFASFPRVSIDYGIMEKARDIYTLPSSFTWLDVGNWNAMDKIHKMDPDGNVLYGDVTPLDTKQSIIYSATGRLVALIGADDLVVVDTEDVLLVSTRARQGEIKRVLEKLRETGREAQL